MVRTAFLQKPLNMAAINYYLCILYLLFNMFILPTAICRYADLMKTTVVPLLKNKSGDLCDINNSSNCTSRTVLASYIGVCHTQQLSDTYDTSESDYQFGFKSGHSTDLGCWILKHVGPITDRTAVNRPMCSLVSLIYPRRLIVKLCLTVDRFKLSF